MLSLKHHEHKGLYRTAREVWSTDSRVPTIQNDGSDNAHDQPNKPPPASPRLVRQEDIDQATVPLLPLLNDDINASDSDNRDTDRQRPASRAAPPPARNTDQKSSFVETAKEARARIRGLQRDVQTIAYSRLMHRLQAPGLPSEQSPPYRHILAAQVLSAGQRGTGTWLSFAGNFSGTSALNDNTFIHALRARLGIPFFDTLDNASWSCACPGQASPIDQDHDCEDSLRPDTVGALSNDPFHVLGCQSSSLIIAHRHDAARDLLLKTLADATGRPTDIEPAIGTSGDHRADIRAFVRNTIVLIDVSFVTPSTATRVRNWETHLVAEAASSRRHTAKLAKYTKICKRADHGVIPFVIETSGRVYSQSAAWLDKIFPEDSSLRQRFYAQLSIICARFNGTLGKTAASRIR